MEIINRRPRMSSIVRRLRRENKTIGFVPTMGALHEGHLSLVKEARQMCDVVVVSIFVNPEQFSEKEDFQNYPRDLTADTAFLTEYQVDYIFAPDREEIYGENFSTYVYVENLTETLEGASRPGHFRGVATVVTILLNTIRPDFTYIGQKDAQQAIVLKRLVKDLGFQTEIVVLPIVREESGLAMSSRNSLLSDDERQSASILYKALKQAKHAAKDGERNASRLTEIVRETIRAESSADIDYIAAVDNETLAPVEKVGESAVLIAVAANFGRVRLIDNTIINKKQ